VLLSFGSVFVSKSCWRGAGRQWMFCVKNRIDGYVVANSFAIAGYSYYPPSFLYSQHYESARRTALDRERMRVVEELD